MENNAYQACTCYDFDGEYVLCEECIKWMDCVEAHVEKHLNEFKPIVQISCKATHQITKPILVHQNTNSTTNVQYPRKSG